MFWVTPILRKELATIITASRLAGKAGHNSVGTRDFVDLFLSPITITEDT